MKRKSNAGNSVEEAILAALKGPGGDVPIFELLDRVGNRGIEESTVRAAITRLLAESKLVLTPGRRIHLALNGNL